MAQDTVDAVVQCKDVGGQKRSPSIEVLNCEMPDRYQKDRGKRVLRTLLNRLRLRRTASVDISQPDPSYKVAYLGNVVTGWAKGDGCVEKPLATLWRNYTQSSRPDVSMQLTISGGSLKATTRDHGLTEYWANRLTCCASPAHFPRIFCWVYRHEGRRLRHELRCHAVLCTSVTVAKEIETVLKQSISLALAEFKRDKVSRQNARLSLANCIYDNPSMPRRKILLSSGSNNYRPPLERSKSAPKLMSIEENAEEDEEIFEGRPRSSQNKKLLRHHDSSSALLDKRRHLISVPNENCKPNVPRQLSVPVSKDFSICDNQINEDSKVKRDSLSRVKFSDNLTLGGISEDSDLGVDEKSNLVLEALIHESLTANDVEIGSCNENCERTWFRNLRDGTDLIPVDSDEGSLSSGCESASTVTSDIEQTAFTTITEAQDETLTVNTEEKKTECDFKVGGCVLNRVRSLEKLSSSDFRKFCGLNGSLSTTNILNEEVSLVPVGETQADFSSLKVYKRRSNSDSGLNVNVYSIDSGHQGEQHSEKNAHDEGYDEVVVADDDDSSISNYVVV